MQTSAVDATLTDSVHTPPSQASSLPLSFATDSSQSVVPDRDEMMQISRDATPSSPSASASARSMSASASSPSSPMVGVAESGQKASNEEADVEKLLRKVELEKKMHQLQQRLELASVKATNGWADMPMNKIENKLPATPLRSRKTHLSVHTNSPMGSTHISASPTIPYEPPSPSRPWQLTDVLWQPLPPPSRGGAYPPLSPSSPMKRARTEEHPESPRTNNGHAYPMVLTSPSSSRTPAKGHRRASSSLSGQTLDQRMQMIPVSPLRYDFEERERKKRSQSHSVHNRARRIETTSQDVDAAKALTFMLGGGSDDDAMSRRDSSSSLLSAAEPSALPIPESFAAAPSSPTRPSRRLSQSTPRARDLRTPNSHARSRLQPPDSGSSTEVDRPEEDKTAAELMMYLAHSPMKYVSPSAAGDGPESPSRPTFGSAARVLFTEEDGSSSGASLPMASSLSAGAVLPSLTHHRQTHSKGGSYSQSNLGVAPPITLDNEGGVAAM